MVSDRELRLLPAGDKLDRLFADHVMPGGGSAGVAWSSSWEAVGWMIFKLKDLGYVVDAQVLGKGDEDVAEVILSGHKGHVRVKCNSLPLALCRAAVIMQLTGVGGGADDPEDNPEDVF